MPSKVFFTVGGGGSNISANTFFNVCGRLNTNTTEANVELSLIKSGGTLSGGKVYISANSNAVTTTFDLVINSTVGNQSIAVTTLATGLFEDADSDTVALNDEVNWEVTASAYVNITVEFATVSFEPTTFHHIFVGQVIGTLCNTAGARFGMPNGTSIDADESKCKLNMKLAGTLEKCRVLVTGNAATNTNTVKSRVNGVDGGISVSISASTTGAFLDTSGTDSISVDQDISFAGSTATDGNVSVNTFSVCFTPTVANSFISNCGTAGGASFGNVTRYEPPGSRVGNGEATEVNASVKVSQAYTVSKLQTYVSANTGGDAGTIDLRLDTGGGPSSSALTMSITAAATGWFEDASNSVSVSATNTISYRVVGPTSGSFTLTTIAANYVNPATAAPTISNLMLMGVG